MSKYETQAYAILRIVVGFLFLCHGSQKLFGFPPSETPMSGTFVMIAGFIEFFGGLLIFLGLFTRWTAFIACGEMAVAYWMAHGTHAILPIENHGELAMLYCFISLFISTRGAGVFSLDYFIGKKKHY